MQESVALRSSTSFFHSSSVKSSRAQHYGFYVSAGPTSYQEVISIADGFSRSDGRAPEETSCDRSFHIALSGHQCRNVNQDNRRPSLFIRWTTRFPETRPQSWSGGACSRIGFPGVVDDPPASSAASRAWAGASSLNHSSKDPPAISDSVTSSGSSIFDEIPSRKIETMSIKNMKTNQYWFSGRLFEKSQEVIS